MRATVWDWTIIIGLIVILLGITVYVKRFMRSTADFLAANRMAGRYLLTVSSGFSGAISLVAIWEMTYSTGLPPQWWAKLSGPVGLIISLTGFAVYRFRQTRALTLAQFLEERYSRSFRFFAGSLSWVSGVLNYGIFPAITARIIIYFLGLPDQFEILGFTVGTFPVVMLAYLSVAVYIACAGGMISIMITDFIQGALLMLIFVVIVIFLLTQFGWGDIMDGLRIVPDASKSMIDPFKTSATTEFNIWYYLIAVFGTIYGVKSWQGGSGYGSAAKSPHEAVMAGVIGTWRSLVSGMCLLLIPLIAYAVMHLAKFDAMATPIRESINQIADPQIQFQMTVPIFLSHLLPVGLFGLFAAVVICCAISCDDTYIHSWGTILIQDVITPLRGKAFTPKTHMFLLRLSIFGVAAFGFTFSMLFPLKDYILMFFAITGAIYLGGAGAVILGGLYWKGGTTAGAFTAMSIGTLMGLGGICIQQIWPSLASCVLTGEGRGPVPYIIIFLALVFIIMLVIGALLLSMSRYKKAGAINILVGTILGMAGFFLFQNWDVWSEQMRQSAWMVDWLTKNQAKFPINSQWIYFFTMLFSTLGYIIVSLLNRKPAFNMDKMLHRGEYAVEADEILREEARKKHHKFTIGKLIGIGPAFTPFERFIFVATFSWSMFWWLIFVLGCAANMFFDIPEKVWTTYWYIYIMFSIVLGILCTVWIFSGGIGNAFELFRDLRKARVDDKDDGFVRK